MTVLRRMLWRQLRAESLLLTAVAAMMVVGGAVFVGLRSAHRNLRVSQRSYYEQTRFADFWVRLKKMPRHELAAVRQAAGIRTLTGRIRKYATIDLAEVPEPINALILSLPPDSRPTLNRVLIRQGTGFTPDRTNEVLVIEQFARAHHIQPGQTLDVLVHERKERLHVVGTVISAEFTYLLGPGSLVPDPERFGVLFVKREFAEHAFDFDGSVNELVGTWSAADPVLHHVWLNQLEDRLEPFGVVSKTQRRRQVSHQFLDGEIRGLGVSATVLPAIFLVAAALVLHILMMRLARRQRQIVGTLKAIGYADATIFTHFLKFGGIVGVVAGIVGGLAGYLMALVMTRIYRDYFEFPKLDCPLHIDIVLESTLLSLVFAVAGSWQGARSLFRLAPAEAMRPEPPRSGGAVFVERLTFLWHWLDTSWRLAWRTLLRQPFRTSTSLFATSTGAALLTSGLLMVRTVGLLVDHQFRRLMANDGEVVFIDEQPPSAVREIRNLPGVLYAEPVLDLPCTLRHGPYTYRTSITGLFPSARLTRPQTISGRRIPIPEQGLVVDQRLADILHVQPGDWIEVRPTRGDRTARTTPIRAITDGFLGVTAYADIRHVSQLAGESLAVRRVQFVTDKNPHNDERRNRKLKETPAVAMTLSRHDLIDSLEDTIVRNMMAAIVVLVLFSATIFLGSLVNAASISLSERRREVATLLALGYSPWRVGGLFFRETLLVGGVGTAAGLPLGYAITWLSILPYRDNDLFRIPLAGAPWVWWTAAAVGLVFIVAAHLPVQRRIHRLEVRDVLNVRE